VSPVINVIHALSYDTTSRVKRQLSSRCLALLLKQLDVNSIQNPAQQETLEHADK